MKFGRKTGARDDGGAVTPGAEPDARTGADAAVPKAGPRAKPAGGKVKSSQRKGTKRGYLDGQMLIAMPSMGDDRFARSVIYVCAHSTEGAMGIMVNHPA